MADGNDNFKEVPQANSAQDAASHRLLSDATRPMPKGDQVAQAGDSNITASTAGADAKGYDFKVADESPAIQKLFAGTVAENQAASTERIGNVLAQQTTPEGQAIVAQAATQWMKDMNQPDLQKHFG